MRSALLCLSLLVGCVSIEPEPEPTPTPGADPRTITTSGGVTDVRVDATSETAWIGLDLDGDDHDGAGWDLGFQRSNIRVNGGVSGDGDVVVLLADGADFDTLAQAPSGEPWTDRTGDDGTAYAFVGDPAWYDYDPTTHVLTPHDGVWCVRSTEGAWWKIQFLDYYDDAGTSGYVALRYMSVGAPTEGDWLDASSEDWLYLTLDGQVVQVADAANSLDWDVAVQRTRWATNSGASGPGVGGARLLGDADAFDVEAVDTVGFEADAMVPLPGPPGSGEFAGSVPLNAWYDYDPTTHAVSSRRETFAVRGADGALAVWRIEAWDDGRYQLSTAPVARVSPLRDTVVDASDSEAWVYLSLRTGATLDDVATPETDGRWDLALRRTGVRTNSGTSGPGDGGAVQVAALVDDLTEAPAEGYEADVLVPLPGPPGSGETSGNAVLGGWYDYDPVTHAVSPGARAYVVRDAAGGHSRLQVVGWDDGVWTLRWSYAGPVDLDFPTVAR